MSSSKYLIPDAIKKALLLHLVLYEQELNVQRTRITIGDQEPQEIRFPVFSLAQGVLNPPSYEPAEEREEKLVTSDQMIQEILRRSKSYVDSRWSSLFALLCAKNKIYATEQFIYLWMSFNGFYSYLCNCHESVKKNGKIQREIPSKKKAEKTQTEAHPSQEKDAKTGRIKETEQLDLFLKLYNLGNQHVKEEYSRKIAYKVKHLLRSENLEGIYAEEDIPDDLQAKIMEALTNTDGIANHLSAYGYLLCDFAYYHRCSIIHANNPVSLYSYADEQDIKNLYLINHLLEHFLDQHLKDLFDLDALEARCKKLLPNQNENLENGNAKKKESKAEKKKEQKKRLSEALRKSADRSRAENKLEYPDSEEELQEFIRQLALWIAQKEE